MNVQALKESKKKQTGSLIHIHRKGVEEKRDEEIDSPYNSPVYQLPDSITTN